MHVWFSQYMTSSPKKKYEGKRTRRRGQFTHIRMLQARNVARHIRFMAFSVRFAVFVFLLHRREYQSNQQPSNPAAQQQQGNTQQADSQRWSVCRCKSPSSSSSSSKQHDKRLRKMSATTGIQSTAHTRYVRTIWRASACSAHNCVRRSASCT